MVSATVAGLTVNLIPFEVLGLSWLLLREPVTWIQVTGALIVISGVGLATRKPAPTGARVPAEPVAGRPSPEVP